MTRPGCSETIDVDLLILGAGGAGLCAALHASTSAPKATIAIVVKGLLGRAGCTRMVQGGYNAVLTPPDSIEAHFLDTLIGGAWINDQELAWTLVNEAPRRVTELEARYGCHFDRRPDGRIHQKPFAGQSHERTVHKGDLTGIEIMNRLSEQVWARPNILVLEEHRALTLLEDDSRRVGGALVVDMRTGGFVTVSARAVLLAAGGGPSMYKVIACSADKSADGVALAFRAGAALKDMEMVQFHPTGLVIPNSLMTGALLEEGLRGAGGYLRNGAGERFMARHDPDRLERSTRDRVARAAFTEVQEGRGTTNGGVWIDVSHLGVEFVERNFRGMVRRCRDFGRDLAREPVEVAPTAHFLMGGIVIDGQCQTGVEGLFAAGEDAGGVHGANRLGGNGVAESTVFGGIAGDVMVEWIVERGRPRLSHAQIQAEITKATGPLTASGGENLYSLLTRLRQVMWDEVGLVRSGDGLESALMEIEDILGRAAGVRVSGSPDYNLAWHDWLNLTNQATVARLIASSALERRESRGSHFRLDFPASTAAGLVNVHVQDSGAGPQVWSAPVRLTRCRPPEPPVAVSKANA